MENFSSPDSSVASTEAAVATPATPAPSASAQPEAMQSSAPVAEAPAQPDTAQNIETVDVPSDELPDDQAFGQLPGAERASNWAKARARIAELNSQVAGLAPHQSTIEQLEQLGGFERLQQQAALADSLFSPSTDPETGEQMLDEQGLPVYTAEPFIERLVSESPSTFGEIMWKGFDQPNPFNPQETVGHVFLRDRLGLDPALLDIYQQIKSPADAKSYMSQSGQIDPAELQAIPEHYHEAYKTLSPTLRDEVQLMSEEARDQYLMERQELLETRKFREEQQNAQKQAEAERQQAFQARIAERGQQLIQETAQRTITAAREKLKAELNFTSEEGGNDAIWDEIINQATIKVVNDPLLGKDNATAERLYNLAAHYELTGDRMKAAEAKVQADRLATKLTAHFNNAVTSRAAFWSKLLGVSRAAHQQQVNNAQPRVEIASRTSPQQRTNNPRTSQGQSFGFDANQIAQWAAQLEQQAGNR